MNYGKRTCVLVLGMHRSGTSVLAGLLNILGVSFGDKLLAPGADNPKGYFEHADFFHINVAFLQSFGLDGDGRLGELPIDWLYDERTTQFKETIKKIITEQFKDDYIFGFKDPRVSILLPAYLDVLKELDVDVCAVISVRHVAEVAASLEKRNKTPLHESVKTYEYYYRNIDLYTKSIRHIRVRYEDGLHKTQDIVNQLIRSVHHALRPYCDVEQELQRFIEPSLKHHAVTETDFIVSLSQAARQAHIELAQLRAIREQDVAWWKEQIDQLRKDREVYISELTTTFAQERSELEAKYAELEQAYNMYKHEQHLEYVRADTHRKYVEQLVQDREKNIRELHGALTNIERSFVWKCVKGWDMLIGFLLPKDTLVRRWYTACVRFQQYVLNDWLPHQVLRLLKRVPQTPVLATKETFWDRFHRIHPTVDVLFVNHEESRTGAPRIVFDVAAYLQQSLRVAMVSLKGGSMKQEFEQVFGPVIYPHELFHLHTEYDRALRILKHVKPRLVYVNSITSYQFARAAKELGIPTIFHVHELDIAFQIVFNKKEREQFHTYADMFIAVSQPVYTLLVEHMHCPKERVCLLHEFVDRERIMKQSAEIEPSFIEKELYKQPHDVLVLAVGTFIYRKGADMFMHMAKQIKDSGAPAQFVWIGSRPFKEPFMADFKIYEPYFTLLQEKVNPFPYIAAADIVVLPSREDPFPLVILEAMALRKPTIVFADSGGIKEAVQDSGCIIPDMDVKKFTQAIETLITHPAKREALGTKAVQYQEQYDSSTMLPRFKELVVSMLPHYNE